MNQFVPRTALLTALFCAVAASQAQISGPTPLAWRWSYPTAVSPVGKPVIQGDNVFTAVGGRMFCLDRKSGNQKWRYPLGDPIPGTFRQGIQAAGNTLYAAADNRIIYAIDAESGKSKWQYTSPVSFYRSPVTAGNYIAVPLSDDSIMVLNADNGSPAWDDAYKVQNGIEGGVAVHNENLIYQTRNYEIVSQNLTTKKINWRQRLTQTSGDSTPVIFGDSIFLNAGTFVGCLSASSGGTKWSQNVGSFLAYSPAVSDEGVFVVTREGMGTVLDIRNGRPKSRTFMDLKSIASTSPSAAGKMFVSTGSNGTVNLINPATGSIVWSYLIRPVGKYFAQSTGTGNTGQRQIWTIPATGQAVLTGQTLMVLAADGSLLAFDPDLGVDVTGPAVKMLWPNPGDQVSGQPPLEFIFRIEDESTGVNDSTIAIDMNGSKLDFEFGRDGYAIVRFSSVGKNKPPFDGRKTITVTVTDWLGNESKKQYTLTIDNTLPPLKRPGSLDAAGAAGGGAKGGGGGGIGG